MLISYCLLDQTITYKVSTGNVTFCFDKLIYIAMQLISCCYAICI